MAITIVRESLLHPKTDTALDIENEISRRLVQATAIARLVESAEPAHCGKVLANAVWLLESLLNDAGELVGQLRRARVETSALTRSESRLAEAAPSATPQLERSATS